MQRNNNFTSFDRSVNVIGPRRRNSDLDYFLELPQVSIDTSESLLSSFEMEGFTEIDSISNSYAQRERIHVIKNILEKGLEAEKLSAVEELSSLLTRDRSVSLSIEHNLLHLLSSNLSSDIRLCILSAKCLAILVEFSPYIRDHLFEFGTFHTLHELVDTLQSEDAEIVSKVCTSFLRIETLPSLSISTKVLFDLERHIKMRYNESIPQNHESIPSILVSLRTISYFSKVPQPDVAKVLCTFKAFVASQIEHQDEHVLKAAQVAMGFILPLQDKWITTPHKGYDIELPSPENHLMPPLLWRSSPLCEISPDSPTEKSATDWIVSPIITTPTKDVVMNCLWEGDILICQSVEIFRADDCRTLNEEHASPAQVGLRCIHCKSSPFKKMPFHMVFPAEVSMFAPNLRHIAMDHLTKCLNLPPMNRKRLSVLLQQDNMENVSYASALECFSVRICSKYGVGDRCPTGTGLCLLKEQKIKEMRCAPSNQEQTVGLNVGDAAYESVWSGSPLDCNEANEFHRFYNITNKNSILSESSKQQPHHITTITNKAAGLKPSRTEDSLIDSKIQIDSSEHGKDMLHIQRVHKGKSNVEILIGHDREMITDHLALSLEQMQICYFDKSSNLKNNRDFNDGFPGLECIHCKDEDSHRQFFWSTAFRFVNSSTEFSKHLLSCKYCPDDIKNQLISTKDRHRSQCKSLPVGSLTAFFHRLYRRLFGDIEDIQTDYQLLDIHTDSLPSQMVQNPRSNLQTSASNKIILHVPANDKWLSENEILLRKSIEVFVITIQDKNAIQKKWPDCSKISTNQICFRCLYCSSHNIYSDKSSFFFSAGIEKIRPDAYRFQHHLKRCPNAPDSVKGCFITPIPYTHAKEKSQMWKESAESIGLFTCQNKIGGNIIKTHSLGEPRFKSVTTSPISQQDGLDDSFNLSNVSMETSESEVSIDRRKRSSDVEVSSPSPKVQKVSL